ncbi:MAG: RagB/SusD family nutrient uptake outer membrane protein [Bacteroidales bacterium]|nr:RagB/SusD family nutrient uptake outer membrane protein [Bacteroidales bacterium]
MKKKYISLFLILAVVATWTSCREDFLNVKPAGSLDVNLLSNEKGLDALMVGAYSLLRGSNGQFGWEAASTNWVYGSIRGLESNKGTDSGDQPDINPIQTYSESATNPYLNVKWRQVYEAISRCNSIIMIAETALKEGKITQEQATSYLQQAKTLRGWYHFEAWRMWEKVPYMDEKSDPASATNTEDIRPKIIADLTEGTNLPLDMDAIGKFNKTVSQVLLAKAMMQMNKDYAGALPILNDAKTNGKKPDGSAIGLAATYGEIFDIEKRNGIEAIYTVQYSVNDGSGGANAGNGEVLNFPYKSGGSPGGCCGFFNPTQEFVNSFRTTAAGLPLLDNTYNADPVKSDQGVAITAAFVPDAGRLDPRLDWSVGRRGIPYWDWGKHTGADWIRDQTYSGPYSPKKQVYKKSQEGTYTEVGNWTSGYTANGYRMIRYADLLLMIAECQIETGNLSGARDNINLVRARAANPAGFVMDGAVPAANYVVAEYPATGAPFDTQANARVALRMERKLELGQEGHRFFDLNRWGITVTELNRILTYEKTMPWGNALYGTAVVGSEDVTFPIPQRQLDISNGKLQQNR